MEELIKDYQNGMGIYDICAKYHMGKIKVKLILSENGVEIRKKGKQPMDKSSFVVSDYNIKKYEEHKGFHYVAIDKNSGVSYQDHMNNGGFLTSHIEREYGVEVPSLYERRKYYMETGNYWWEQWFDIVEEKDEEYTIKCPYCDWGTNDEENKSGAYTHHLTSTHHITIKEHLVNHPEDCKYFKKQVKKIEYDLRMNDPDKYVICPICGRKMPKITYSHLRSAHNIGMYEFRKKFPNANILSNEMLEQTIRDQKLCNLKVSKHRFISSYETEINEYLTSIGIEHETNRQILIGKEIDILIPSVRIGIEFDGLQWHTEWFGKKDKDYHLNKTLLCNERGYGLIHIFEDEYVNKRDIVISKIKHLIKMDNDLPKIAGRKVSVREILSSEAKDFLEKYHIQGFHRSTVYIGAFYNNELVAVMSLKKGNVKNKDWELTRFATNYNYTYQGIGGKLFKYFTRTYDPLYVISFADRRWTLWPTDNLYTKIGFELEGVTRPDYRYYNSKIDRFKRVHKMTMSKIALHKKYGFPMTMTEKEMAKELGYDRIWDCGLYKYVWRREV